MPPPDAYAELCIDITMTFLWAYMFWSFYHSGGALVVSTSFTYVQDDSFIYTCFVTPFGSVMSGLRHPSPLACALGHVAIFVMKAA